MADYGKDDFQPCAPNPVTYADNLNSKVGQDKAEMMATYNKSGDGFASVIAEERSRIAPTIGGNTGTYIEPSLEKFNG